MHYLSFWILAAALAVVMASSATQQAIGPRLDRARNTRGFKNVPLSTARGFGKRALHTDPIPVDWLVEEIGSNPDFGRFLIRRFLDLDQDGFISPQELLRPPSPCAPDDEYE